MGVLVVGPETVVTEAISHVLHSSALKGKRVSFHEAARAAESGEVTSVVFLPGPGVDPSGVLAAMRDNPALQLIVVSDEIVDAPVTNGRRPVVVNSISALIDAVAKNEAKSARHGLTERHVRILQQLADGYSPADAASHLGITVKTLNNHLGAVYKRLGTKNVTQAVLTALRSGLIRLPA